jgi:hypothetical protein
MAWGGKVGRMSVKVRTHFLRTSNRRLPMRENPLGVPTLAMRQLQELRLPTPDKALYTTKLVELMRVIETNGG